MMKKDNPISFVYFVIFMVTCWCVLLGGMAQTRNESNVIVKVGAVLDVSNGTVGIIGLSCINMALTDFYESHSHYKTRIQIIVKDSHKDVVTAATHALDLIKNEEVQAIMGPITTMEANYMIQLGDKAQIPIVTFSATSPSLASLESQYFFQISQNDSAQVKAITSIIQAFGWKQVVPIYIDNSFGEGLIHYLANVLQEANIQVPYVSAISLSANDHVITRELQKIMTTIPTRVYIVHMSPDLGSKLFTLAKKIGMMGQGYVWIVTDSIANLFNSLNFNVRESMEGVIGVRTYIPRTKKLDDFRVRWKRKFISDNPTLFNTKFNIFGIWAYDATTALAMAMEKVGIENTKFGYNESNTSSNYYMPNFEKFGIAQNGKKLSEALSNTRFNGLSGDFNVVDGKLQSSIFEIINVIGNGEKRVGFWTPSKGLARNLDMKGLISKNSIYSSSKNDLRSIIWPGDMYSIPPIWKKLKIGVPARHADNYPEFLKVKYDNNTNKTQATGFCIDVFKAAVDILPYNLEYEFLEYAKPDGEMAGTYDELITQLYQGKYDAVVGDVTIIANRSNYVDFTMPYIESGVTMVVSTKDNRKKNAWAFLKPLTWDLWVASVGSFVLFGFVVWNLEHKINDDFRGPPSYQIGTSLWFSFSTMVYAHREKVVSNLTRFVTVVWVFVVLILVQSYTASLTSMLTVEQLSPSITDVNELIRNKMNVGYPIGSYVQGIVKKLGFPDSQLIAYQSPNEFHELFIKGSVNGGIDAAFDEVAYVKHFLRTYSCSKYVMVEPRYKTGGFGYVFPKGSPLVADISRAILNVTEGGKMKTIENIWFNEPTCPDSNTKVSSNNNLGLESFWGLFLIAGIASIIALLFFWVPFLYEHKHIWLQNNLSTSLWRRICILVKIFDQRNLHHYTFKKSKNESENSNIAHHDDGLGAVEASSDTQCPPSPFSQTESNISGYEEFSPNTEMNIVPIINEEVAHVNNNEIN
ncbi:glutamate receptor 2.7-like isoform X2 [Trifolium pratense]|uniref:glutamate receptor 2.7-like isoform X2 n=1 Tax=Trifolium pratense TaxID=57577 RepID=UPI001E693B81|nr:glutamate receptor 2.7-like isoform X2 [Trifolium pratense]